MSDKTTLPTIRAQFRNELARSRRLYQGLAAKNNIAGALRRDAWRAVQNELAWSIAYDVAHGFPTDPDEVQLWAQIATHLVKQQRDTLTS